MLHALRLVTAPVVLVTFLMGSVVEAIKGAQVRNCLHVPVLDITGPADVTLQQECLSFATQVTETVARVCRLN